MKSRSERNGSNNNSRMLASAPTCSLLHSTAQNVYGKGWWEERADAVTRAVEAVATGAKAAEKEANQDQRQI